jgi:hypothetical protein
MDIGERPVHQWTWGESFRGDKDLIKIHEPARFLRLPLALRCVMEYTMSNEA